MSDLYYHYSYFLELLPKVAVLITFSALVVGVAFINLKKMSK